MFCEFFLFDPRPCAFPKPRIPLLPGGLQGLAVGHAFRLLGNARRKLSVRHFTRGRYALYEAYRLAGVGKEGALLAPAYHCRTMLDPAVALEARIYLYPIRSDLSPDDDALDAMIAQADVPVRAILATHFFGIPQNFESLREKCAARGIALVEDCSHVLFSEYSQAPGTGLSGDFVVSSPYKFFPGEDGGLLYARRNSKAVAGNGDGPGFLVEMKGVARSLQETWELQSHGKRLDIGALDAEIESLLGQPGEQGGDRRESCSAPSHYYVAGEEYRESLRWSRWLAGMTDVARLAERRRENYRRWTSAIAGLPNCRPLIPGLPEQCVPYMFPLHIEFPDFHFYLLKRLGVPIWRWDEMGVSDCPVAADYRLKVLHLPCHQGLTSEDMDWMMAAVRKVMRIPAAAMR